MRQKLYSIPISVILFLSNVTPCNIFSEDNEDVSAWESAEWIVNNFDVFRDRYNAALNEEYEAYLADYENMVFRDYGEEILDEDDNDETSYGSPCIETLGEEAGYAESYYPEYLEADCVSSIADISITATDENGEETSEEGYFLTFNNGGYLTIGSDNRIYGFEPVGNELVSDMIEVSLSFVLIYGYNYAAKDGNVITELMDLNRRGCDTSLHKGQLNVGCGRIYRPDMYIDDKYGPGYTRSSYRSFSMHRMSQKDLSVYYKYEDDICDYTGEGNCWMVSAYLALDSMVKNGKMNGTDEWEFYNPKDNERTIYDKYIDSKGNGKRTVDPTDNQIKQYELNSDRMQNGKIYFPSLYVDFRKYANDYYGKCEWGTGIEAGNMMVDIEANYGKTLSYQIHDDWTNWLNDAVAELKQKKPLIWRTQDCTYGAHMMAVSGYEMYQRDFIFGTEDHSFKFTKTKLLFQISDGQVHGKADRREYSKYYYDMSSHLSNQCFIMSFDY